MAGGLLNLIAVGNQNTIIHGDPQKTFFKVKYAKHTNFGVQKVSKSCSATPDRLESSSIPTSFGSHVTPSLFATASSSPAASNVGFKTLQDLTHFRSSGRFPSAASPIATDGGTSTSKKDDAPTRFAMSSIFCTPDSGNCEISVVAIKH